MAAESCTGRVARLPSELALRMREPARRFFGSVPTAAVICAVIVGVYNIVVGTIYFSETYHFFFGMAGLITTAGSLAFLASVADTVVIFGVLRRKEEYLHSIICAALAIYMICIIMPFCVVIGLSINGKWMFILWEVPRILLYPVHVCVLYCLLTEVRAAPSPPSPLHSPAADDDDDGRRAGWLSGNIAHSGHGPLGGGKVPAPVHFAQPKHPGPCSFSEA